MNPENTEFKPLSEAEVDALIAKAHPNLKSDMPAGKKPDYLQTLRTTAGFCFAFGILAAVALGLAVLMAVAINFFRPNHDEPTLL